MINEANKVDSEGTDSDDNDYFKYYIDKSTKSKYQVKSPYLNVFCEKSLYFFSMENCFRKFCARIVSNPRFELLIGWIIIFSSMKLMIDTYVDLDQVNLTVQVLDYIDIVFNIIFTFELLVKVIRNGLIVDEGSYLKDSWHVLDSIIVTLSLVDMLLSGADLGFIKILRLFRILRTLRFVSSNKNMKIVVSSLFRSLNAILNVFIVILMAWIMFGILGMSFFADKLGYCFKEGLDYYKISKDMCATPEIGGV